MTTEVKSKKEKEPLPYSATQRAEAVLSVWTERRRPTEVSRDLGITTAMLSDWQERAMSGMLRALEPRRCVPMERGPALSAKLERLLARQGQADGKPSRLEKRLAKLQQEEKPATPPKEK